MKTFGTALLAFTLLMGSFIQGVAQQKEEDVLFEEYFHTSKQHIAQGQYERALPVLQQLYSIQPANANIHYLLGVCYTESGIINPKSISHLERAAQNITLDYNMTSSKEKDAPVYAWYYLVLACKQNGKCGRAEEALQRFKKLYDKDDNYTLNAETWVNDCNNNVERAAAKNKKPVSRITGKERDVVTKDINYTTPMSLYGVQVGAFKDVVPLSEFYPLKNVSAFMDNQGMIRYVIGNFSLRSQADHLLEAVKTSGYKDAFVVDVNKEKKYTKEVVTVDNRSIHATLRGDVDFKVQLGAFRDSIPSELLHIYLSIPGIKEHSREGMTILTVGSYDTYNEAVVHRDQVAEAGVPGPFIIAYNQGKRVPLKEAKSYAEKLKMKREKEEAAKQKAEEDTDAY